MANFFREPDRRQRFLLPVDMKDWVPETDMVHLLLDVVTLMELTAFEAHYTKRGTGAPPFGALDDGVRADLRLCQWPSLQPQDRAPVRARRRGSG